jgi:hypothetical protein
MVADADRLPDRLGARDDVMAREHQIGPTDSRRDISASRASVVMGIAPGTGVAIPRSLTHGR